MTDAEPSVADADGLRVERLVNGGRGLALLPDGRVAFVPRSAPGDVIRPLEVRDRGRHVEVQRHELVAPSPERRAELPCAVASSCGGCDWMQLTDEAQLVAKRELLIEALRRVGRFEDLEARVGATIGAERLEYRERVRLHVSPNGRPGYLAEGSRDHVAVSDCPVAAPEVRAAVRWLAREAGRDASLLTGVAEIELRRAPLGAGITAAVWPAADGTWTEGARLRLSGHYPMAVIAPKRRGGAKAPQRRRPPESPERAVQRWPLPGGAELSAAPGDFTQVHWAVNTALVTAVRDGLLARSCRTFLDLYCGAGNFSLVLRAAGLEGVGVEASRGAIERARQAAAAAPGLPLELIVADAGQAAADLVRAGRRFDAVVLDPPRTGATPEALAALAKLTDTVVMVSCDPVTLARDCRTLVDSGFDLERAEPYDMFPQTHHFESLAWLSRRP